jgi:phosphate transport system protein
MAQPSGEERASGPASPVGRQVARLFSLVAEALAGATDALLGGEAAQASRIVEADYSVDQLTSQLSTTIWGEVERLVPDVGELRRLVGLLMLLPELERSADLAEHIAKRAVNGLGPKMSPVSRGIVQRMSEVALEMWGDAATSYARGRPAGSALDEADEELDILLERLTFEVASSQMAPQVAAQVTLVGRFYERLGDHAVNVARRIELLGAAQGGAGLL